MVLDGLLISMLASEITFRTSQSALVLCELVLGLSASLQVEPNVV